MSGKLRLFCTHQDRPHENLSKTTIYLSNLGAQLSAFRMSRQKEEKGKGIKQVSLWDTNYKTGETYFH